MLNVCQVGVEIKFTVTKVYFHLFVLTKVALMLFFSLCKLISFRLK